MFQFPFSPMRYTQTRFRRVLQGRLKEFPEFTLLGYDIFTRADRLMRHRHVGLFEICLIQRGHVIWCAPGKEYHLRGGDVFFTWPDEVHGGLDELMHPCAIYWMHVRVPRPGSAEGREFLRLRPEEARELCTRLYALQDRHLRGAELLEPYCKTLFEQLGRCLGEDFDPLAVVPARAALQGMLCALTGLQPALSQAERIPPGLVRAQGLLDGCPSPWPSVKELAEIAGMSASYFHSQFVKHFGQAPMEYGQLRRLEKARELLAKDHPGGVTGVAARLGYCSSQHLAACFRRTLGITPRQARTQARAQK